jgi:hypothetical protein
MVNRGVRLLYRNTPIGGTTAVEAPTDPDAPGSEWQQEQNRRIAGVAALIAGDAPEPAWLRQGLESAVGALYFALNDEADVLTRKKQRKILNDIQLALRVLDLSFTMKFVRSALEGPDQAGFDAIADAQRAIADIRPLVTGAIAAIPRGKGKQKHYPIPVKAPLPICADFVSVAWCEVRGRPVPYTSKAAQQACEELWDLAGGGSRQHSSGIPSCIKGWREHLLASKDLPDSAYDQFKELLIGRWRR